jgi:hypothetical protein
MGLQAAVVKAYQLHGVLRYQPRVGSEVSDVRRSQSPRGTRPDRNCSLVNCQHPFGDQAASQKWLALGFAPQPCDWFAFIEDDDAAGP